MTAPYDPFPAIAALLSCPEGRLILERILGEHGVDQAVLDAAVAELPPPQPPAKENQ